MAEIFPILQSRHFSLGQAESLLPIVKRVTQKALGEFLILEEKLRKYSTDSEQSKIIEKEISELLNRWGQKILKLGGIPKGIWLVDFDNGEGYYCWRYGEEKIEYAHRYQESFAQRAPIANFAKAALLT